MRSKPLVVGSLFVALHVGIPAACAAALSSYAHFGRRGLVLHVMWLVTACAGVLLPAIIADRVAKPRSAMLRAAFAAGCTAFVVALALLYAGAFVGNREWGGGLTYHIVFGFGSLALPNRPPFFIPWSVHATAAVGLSLLAVLYWFTWPPIVVAAGGLRPSLRARRAVVAGAAVWVVALAGMVTLLARTGALSREPIAGFFVISSGVAGFTGYSLDRQLPEVALRARADYPKRQIFDRRNVVLVMVDALRADHMGVYGYGRPTTPFLSDLAGSGRLKKVELALSSCAESSCGILSTITSKPFRHLSTPNFSILNLLRDQGYDIYQILSADHTFAGERAAYGDGQTAYFDSSSSARFGVNDDNAIFEGLEQVPDYADRPALLHFHLMSVHFAGVKHDAFKRWSPWLVRQDFASIVNSRRDLVALVNNYDNGVLEADDTIRRLFDELGRKGYLQDSLVVIVADHGEGLGDRDPGPDGLGHVHSLRQEFIRIPLLIYDQADAPYANLSFATQVDVAPTIVERLGLQVPPSFEGRSLLQPEPRRYSFMQTSRWSPCYAVVEWQPSSLLKYMRCEDTAGELLFDLQADPMERVDLMASADRAAIDRLRSALARHLAVSSVSSASSAARASDDR